MAIKKIGDKVASIIDRKTAKAMIVEGKEKGIFINGKSMLDYLKQDRLIAPIKRVMDLVGLNLNLIIKVFGSGICSQADAIRCGIARYIAAINPEHDLILRAHKMLDKDSRRVERKKYGKYKARKAHVFRRR